MLLRSLDWGTFHSSIPQTAPSSPYRAGFPCPAYEALPVLQLRQDDASFGSRALSELHSPRKALLQQQPGSPCRWGGGERGLNRVLGPTFVLSTELAAQDDLPPEAGLLHSWLRSVHRPSPHRTPTSSDTRNKGSLLRF